MHHKLTKNLDMLMNESQLSAEELARRIGLPASTIKKIRNGLSNPTLSTLEPIAEYFCLTLSELVGDSPLAKSRIKGTYKLNEKFLYQIPVIRWKDVPYWIMVKSSSRIIRYITTEYSYSNNTYGLIVETDEVATLPSGTALIIDPDLKMDHRDFVIVSEPGKKVPTIKQILFNGSMIYFKTISQQNTISRMSAEHKVLGVVAEYKKNLKNLSSNIDLGKNEYCNDE